MRLYWGFDNLRFNKKESNGENDNYSLAANIQRKPPKPLIRHMAGRNVVDALRSEIIRQCVEQCSLNLQTGIFNQKEEEKINSA